MQQFSSFLSLTRGKLWYWIFLSWHFVSLVDGASGQSRSRVRDVELLPLWSSPFIMRGTGGHRRRTEREQLKAHFYTLKKSSAALVPPSNSRNSSLVCSRLVVDPMTNTRLARSITEHCDELRQGWASPSGSPPVTPQGIKQLRKKTKGSMIKLPLSDSFFLFHLSQIILIVLVALLYLPFLGKQKGGARLCSVRHR